MAGLSDTNGREGSIYSRGAVSTMHMQGGHILYSQSQKLCLK